MGDKGGRTVEPDDGGKRVENLMTVRVRERARSFFLSFFLGS